jgi:thiamine-phosphate pyrophosphorylase
MHFESRLYPIVDPAGAPGRSHVELAEAVAAAGAPLFQVRVKHASTRDWIDIARAVSQVAHRYGARLIVNDRADIALLVGADGVHLGQDDLPPAAARQILGPHRIIGFSTHNRTQILAAATLDAVDYVAFGPVFPTRSKENPDPAQGLHAIETVRPLVRVPLVAIGGITTETLPAVLTAGADAVAVISAISHAADPQAQTRHLLERVDAATAPPRPRRS